MNWFDTSGLTSLAKNALKEAQKTIDKALDIQDESGDEPEEEATPQTSAKSSPGHSNTSQKDNTDFFSSWGLTVSAESEQNTPIKEQPVVTESPSKSTSQSIWGSFAGSFFEQPKDEDSTIVRPPKAKSMNVIADHKYGSQDDLFSKSQLIMSDSEALDHRITKSLKDELPKVDERRDSAKSHRLSLVSSRNSSDSVEVLSQSLKTTPDSEASVHSMSRSSSTGQKHNSESVEILPDSLVSSSSIECLGFDSYSSEKKSNSSSLCVSPGDYSDKKSTPVGDKTEKADTADSVSLVADDDEDTMSYNSISECTAPTVLDTDDKSVSPFTKVIKTDASRKVIEKELMHLEQALVPQRMQLSENSSNDGSWSDRTLNADGDSINLDMTAEDQKKEQEDVLIEKLSDSSSFYNVNVSSDMLRSESSAFVNVEKQQCNESSSSSSQKDGSVKERTSPISSDSKSDLVKIGSDRTSGHTSGDELETATSSDIEIIPSPNGDGHGFRNSPAKYAFKQSKFDGTTSPNLVDLVLGKSLATKIRGHNRELSEASVQSNTSDESQGSENERLMRRLCEMAELLEARENRLLEMSRNNADLAENNADLKSQVESLMLKHEGGDINTITEDYTQRMSALEKKFQQAIREKDQLRKQLDQVKSESSSRKNSSELENTLKEKDEVIAQLQEEGEKLARQQLQHSNIIKKLRAKEKDNEQVIKGLRDKIAEQSAELDRLKRSIAAKEELEVSQIEAVYRLTTANKKLETELMETRSQLDDTQHKLESSRTSLEGARRELAELQRTSADLSRRATAAHQAQSSARLAEQDLHRLRTELAQLREDRRAEEKKWVSREEGLRRELQEAREACSALEGRADEGAGEGAGPGAGPGAAPGAGLRRAVTAVLRTAARLMRCDAAAPHVLHHLTILFHMPYKLFYQQADVISCGMYEIVKTSAQNVHSAAEWDIVFALLCAAGAGAWPADARATSPAASSRSEGSEDESERRPTSASSESELSHSPQTQGWILVKNETECTEAFDVEGNVSLRAHRASALARCCEALALVVRDVAHVTPYNCRAAVRAVRLFARATLHTGKKSGKSRSGHKSRPSSGRRRYDDSSDEEVDTLDQYHMVSIQLLDLMHTLHSRTAQIFKWWRDEADQGQNAEEYDLWEVAWKPLLQGIAQFCTDRRKQVSNSAVAYLQRALLVPGLAGMGGARWEAAFHHVLFPLLELLPRRADVTARAHTIMCKVFLQHLSALSARPSFGALWVRVLDRARALLLPEPDDPLTEAALESLKNMILVMDSVRIFSNADGYNDLWYITWDKINEFLPNLKEELFPQVKDNAKPAGLPSHMQPTLPPSLPTLVPVGPTSTPTLVPIPSPPQTQSQIPSPILAQNLAHSPVNLVQTPPLVANAPTLVAPTPISGMVPIRNPLYDQTGLTSSVLLQPLNEMISTPIGMSMQAQMPMLYPQNIDPTPTRPDLIRMDPRPDLTPQVPTRQEKPDIDPAQLDITRPDPQLVNINYNDNVISETKIEQSELYADYLTNPYTETKDISKEATLYDPEDPKPPSTDLANTLLSVLDKKSYSANATPMHTVNKAQFGSSDNVRQESSGIFNFSSYFGSVSETRGPGSEVFDSLMSTQEG